MKKLIAMLFMIIMTTGIGCANLPSASLAKIPFFGGFVDTTPKDIAAIHADVMDHIIPVPGTAKWEYSVLPNGGIAGHVTEDGFRGWCSNYVVAVEHELSKIGYSRDQMERTFCSIYDTGQPDHVVLSLDHPDGHKYIFDSRYTYVQTPGDYSKVWTKMEDSNFGAMLPVPPYIWWAKADGEWIKVDM